MIAVVDYGVGNLYSLTCSLRRIGAQATVTREESELRQAEKIILPGVGAFGDAADKLRSLRLDALLSDQAALGKPLLGVCLGMQLLFDKSEEYGTHAGLGMIHGRIKPLAPQVGTLKVPHMGWNSVAFAPGDPVSRDFEAEPHQFYFVHSYYTAPTDDSIVWGRTEYGGKSFVSAVRRGRCYATQFHPEKSQADGLKLYRNFLDTL